MGGELLDVSGLRDAGLEGMGIDTWPMVGMVDGGSLADECGLLSALVLSLYFLYPFCPCISYTHLTNCLPPIFHVPLCPLFPTINNTRSLMA